MNDQITEPTMTEPEARECIQQVHDNLMDTRELLLDLHDRSGWKVLGYDSWEKCVTSEFKDKRTYLFYQLAAAKVERNLVQSTIVDKIGTLPETHLRPLAKLDPDQQREVYRQAVETAPEGKVTAKHIEETVKEINGGVAERLKAATGDDSPIRVSDVNNQYNPTAGSNPAPTKPEPTIIAPDFLAAYAEMRKQIVKAQGDKWTTTTRTEAVKFITRLLEMVTREGEEK